MATVLMVFRNDKKNKKDECPIHFRIIKNRKVSYIASGLMIHPTLWDEEKNKIKSKHPNSARLNSFLSNKFTELQDHVFEHETLSKNNTNKQLKEKIHGKLPQCFFTFAESSNKEYESAGKIGTYDKNKGIIEKLRKYTVVSTTTFQDIDAAFLYKYETYMRTDLNNKTNTCVNSFKFISQMFKKAYNHDLIDHSINPFNKFKIKEEKTRREYLTEDELILIDKYQHTLGTKVNLHKDMFVFASYAGGVRVSDMLQLKWKDFDGVSLNITMKKTGGQISIKVPKRALEIINSYRPEKDAPNTFVFPNLPADINMNDPKEVDTALSRSTALINKNLNIISDKTNLNKHISFHISRHTWATRALRKGISIDKVSKLMGHSQIKETQIYAKIVNEELDKAMDLFND